MAKKETKIEGPTCACGRVDLYEEWSKQNEAGEKEETLIPANQSDKINAANIAAKQDKKPEKIKAKH